MFIDAEDLETMFDCEDMDDTPMFLRPRKPKPVSLQMYFVEHLAGVTSCKSPNDSTAFFLRYDNKKVMVTLSCDTRVQLETYKPGDTVHVLCKQTLRRSLADGFQDVFQADIVCDDAFYRQFDQYDDEEERFEAMLHAANRGNYDRARYRRPHLDVEKHVVGRVKSVAMDCEFATLFDIEAVTLPDENGVYITGFPGDVKDGISIARSYLRNVYDVPLCGYHVHANHSVHEACEGYAVPFLIAMLSAHFSLPIPQNAAFLGGLSLLGHVESTKSIGSLVKQLYAALLAGCTKVYIPAEDYNMLPDELIMELESDGSKIVSVMDVVQIIDEIFPQLRYKKRR